ncbi:RDD family protein [Poriferisphaera sp. WC338]|uniref:RDD family protein n=1 Tax=Poriferisphaera sp. WC338 TaxID=3425129 RepID=UPI003D816FCE
MLMLVGTAWVSVFASAHAEAQSLTAVSDGEDLWFVQPHDQDAKVPQVSVYHRNVKDEAGQITYAHSFSGILAPGGLAVRDKQLWLAYKIDNGIAFQTLSPVKSVAQDFWQYTSSAQSPITVNCELRSLAVNETNAFALVQFANEADAKAAEAKTREANQVIEDGADSNAITTILEDQPVSEPQTQDEAKPQSNAEAALSANPTTSTNTDGKPVDRLMVHDRARWTFIDLPLDWPHVGKAWMVAGSEQAAFPVLAVQGVTDLSNIRIYQHDGEGWQRTNINWPNARGFAMLEVNKQLALAVQQPGSTLSVGFDILRNNQELKIGKLDLPLKSDASWAAVPYNGHLGVIAANPEHKPQKPTSTPSLFALPSSAEHNVSLTLAELDLQGKEIGKPTTLTAYEPQAFELFAQYMITFGVLMAAMILLMIFMMRDPAQNKLALPKQMVLCDFSKRLYAGMIDILPIVLIVKFSFNLSFTELWSRWPGAEAGLSWEKMVPALIIIGAFILYTTVSEIATGRTVGKKIAGIRVVTIKGEKPAVGQLLGRGLSKLLDLLVPILLLFPLISMNRQRVGDMAMQTVVVMDTPQPMKLDHLDQDEKED